MSKCPDCGYQLEAFETDCPRCRQYGKPVPPPYVPPAPEPVFDGPQVVPPNVFRAVATGFLTFLIPAILTGVAGLLLMMFFHDPVVKAVPQSFLVDFATIIFLIPLTTGAILGAFATGHKWEGPWGAIAGMGIVLGWTLALYALSRTLGSGTHNAVGSAAMLVPVLTPLPILVVAIYSSVARDAQGHPWINISILQLGAAFFCALIPCLGALAIPMLKDREDGLDSAASVGVVFGILFWGFRVLHP